MAAKSKQAFVLREFNDAGTGESFAANAVQPIETGAFHNYHDAGLVREPTAAELKAAKPAT